MSRIMPAGIAASAGAALANMAVVPEPFTTVKPVLAEGFPRAVTGEHVWTDRYSNLLRVMNWKTGL